MTTVLIVVGVFAALFSGIAVFLGTEFLKKFLFMRDFIRNTNQLVAWSYKGDRERGMYNIVLRGQKPFCALVGFRLEISILGYVGYDYYGFVCSNKNGVAVISTYLGKGDCDFQFLVTTDLDDNPISVSSSPVDQGLTPHEVYRPHWYQRIGFYG